MPDLSLVARDPSVTTSFDELIRYRKPRRHLPVLVLPQERNGRDYEEEEEEQESDEISETYEVEGEEVESRIEEPPPEFDIQFDDWLGKFGVRKKTIQDSREEVRGSVEEGLMSPRRKRNKMEGEEEVEEGGEREENHKMLAEKIGEFKARDFAKNGVKGDGDNGGSVDARTEVQQNGLLESVLEVVRGVSDRILRTG